MQRALNKTNKNPKLFWLVDLRDRESERERERERERENPKAETVKPLLRSAKATTDPPPDRPSPHRLTPTGCCCRHHSVTPDATHRLPVPVLLSDLVFFSSFPPLFCSYDLISFSPSLLDSLDYLFFFFFLISMDYLFLLLSCLVISYLTES